MLSPCPEGGLRGLCGMSTPNDCRCALSLLPWFGGLAGMWQPSFTPQLWAMERPSQIPAVLDSTFLGYESGERNAEPAGEAPGAVVLPTLSRNSSPGMALAARRLLCSRQPLSTQRWQ